MIETAHRRNGRAWAALAACGAATLIGLTFDFLNAGVDRFWFGPGAFALAGVAAALFCVLAVNAARVVLKKREESGDA